MGDPDWQLVRQLIREEVRRVIADTIESKRCVSVGRYAALIHQTYPNSGMTPEQIGDEILTAAISARVAVEMSRPE